MWVQVCLTVPCISRVRSPSGSRPRCRPSISVRLKSLGVNTSATPSSSSALGVAVGMIPPTITGTSSMPGRLHPVEHVGHQLHVRAGEDREPDAVHVLGDGGGDDLLRRQPDALVDDLEAGVACPDGDLLGAVGVPVQAGLADQQPQPPAELLAGRSHPLADRRSSSRARLGDADRAGDTGGRAELAEHLAQRAGPLPRRRPRAGGDAGWPASGSRRSSRPRRGRRSAVVDLGLVALRLQASRPAIAAARPPGRRPGSRRRGRR